MLKVLSELSGYCCSVKRGTYAVTWTCSREDAGEFEALV